MKRIEVGDTWTFEDDQIFNIQYTNTVDVTGAELTIDTFEARVVSPVGGEELLTYDGYNLETSGGEVLQVSGGSGGSALSNAEYATPVLYYKDNVLIGKYFVQSVTREQRDVYVLHCVSAVGLMSRRWCNPIYSGNYNITKMLTAIIGASGDQYTYTIDSSVSGITNLLGYVDYNTQRINLHKFLFAYDIHIKKDANGDMVFYRPTSAEVGTIPANRTYLNGSIDYSTAYGAVQVTGYAYETTIRDAMQELELVYESADGEATTERTVYFPFPIVADKTWIITNGTIQIKHVTTAVTEYDELYPVYAVITGAGQIYARRATMTEFTVKKTIQGSSGTEVFELADNQMICMQNIDNVVSRLVTYIKNRQVIKGDIVLDGETVGNVYNVTNAFEEQASAFMQKMSVNVSSIDKATCEMVSGYVGSYSHDDIFLGRTILTDSGTWTIPSRILEKDNPIIKVFLVGGGQGGSSSCAGKSGGNGSSIGGQGGQGGIGGIGGDGGNIFVVDLDVTGLTSISYSCGTGGSGGTPNASTPNESQAGSLGTDTTFGGYSSSSGHSYESGAPIWGMILGAKGVDGINGADGGDGGDGETSRCDGDNSEDYGTDGNYTHGIGGAGKVSGTNVGGGGGGGGGWVTKSHGGGSGNAGQAGSNYGLGGNGGAGQNGGLWYIYNGGYGQGGQGASGGGGGGGGGGYHGTGTGSCAGNGNSGGSAWNGENGNDGCVCILY